MAEAIQKGDEALRVARSMAANKTTITPWNSRGSRHSFRHDGVVHAHLIEDGWKIVGFSRRWFAIRPER